MHDCGCAGTESPNIQHYFQTQFSYLKSKCLSRNSNVAWSIAKHDWFVPLKFVDKTLLKRITSADVISSAERLWTDDRKRDRDIGTEWERQSERDKDRTSTKNKYILTEHHYLKSIYLVLFRLSKYRLRYIFGRVEDENGRLSGRAGFFIRWIRQTSD